MGLLMLYFALDFFLATPGISIHQQGIEPRPPAVEAWSLNHGSTREISVIFKLINTYF